MQVKVFEAEDMTTALKKVKATLGPDAIILSSRTLRKKGMGLLSRPLVEVTAAKEAPDVAPLPSIGRNPYAQAARQDQPRETPARVPRPVVEPVEAELQELRSVVQQQQSSTSTEVGALRDEISQLKHLVEQQSQRQAAPAPAPQSMPTAVPSTPASPMRQRLIDLGVVDDVADTLVHYASRLAADQSVEHQLHTLLSSLIQPAPSFTEIPDGPRKIALVGPTGVGKTTTLAKLAAQAVQAGLRVALVTIDTYRIAAVEQLRVYGDIMNLPVEVVLSPDELPLAFGRHRDKDLILIDTAGRSPRDIERIQELQTFIESDNSVESCLVLPANGRDRELETVIRQFGQLSLSALIFTKLDECDALGVLINIASRTELPLAYVTDGQRVPEDIRRAQSDEIAARILNTSEDRP